MGAKVLRLLPGLAAIAVLLGLCVPANAHPHVWVTVETTLLYERGAFTGLQAQVDLRRVLLGHGG